MNITTQAMNVNNIISLLIIFCLSSSCTNFEKEDKFIDIIYDIETEKEKDISKLKSIKLENDYLEGLRLNYIKHYNRQKLKNDFKTSFLGEYYAQNKSDQKFSKFKVSYDSLHLIFDSNNKESLEYNIYYSYESNNKMFYKESWALFFKFFYQWNSVLKR
jgi:rRNA maturation protein Rpf1